MSVASIRAQLDVLHQQLVDLRNRRQQQELEIANIENYALRKRFQDILDKLLVEQLEKEQEVNLCFIQTWYLCTGEQFWTFPFFLKEGISLIKSTIEG